MHAKQHLNISYYGYAALYLTLIGLNTATLARGSVTPLLSSIFAALSLVAMVLYFCDKIKEKNYAPFSWYSLPFVLGFIFTLSMLIPLPLSWRKLFTPYGTSLLELTTKELPLELQNLVWPALSMDPPETAFRLIQLIPACCFFFIIFDYSRYRALRKIIFRAFFIGALVFFAVSVTHAVLDVQIWGLYGSKSSPLYAPLVNPNNLARVFGLYAFLCMAGALNSHNKFESYWFALGAILCGAGTFLTLSRGGILAILFSGALCLFWLSWADWKKNKQSKNTKKWLWVKFAFGATTLVIIICAFLIAGQQIVTEMLTLQGQIEHADKADLFRIFPLLIEKYWQVGVGPNALYSTFFSPISNEANLPFLLSGKVNIPSFENSFLQALITHGLFKGAFLLLICAAIFFNLLRKSSTHNVIILLTSALIFVVVGDIVDFSLEIGAILWLVAATVALCAGLQNPVSSSTAMQKTAPILRVHTAFACLLLFSCCYFSLYAINNFTDDLDKKIADASDKITQSQIELAKHPLNSEITLKVAKAYADKKNYAQEEKWARITTILRPVDERGYLLLAQGLVMQRKYPEAIVALKEAWTANPGNSRLTINALAALVKIPNLLFNQLPREQADYLIALCSFYAERKLEEEFSTCANKLSKAAELKDEHRRRAADIAINLKQQGTALAFYRAIEKKEPDIDQVQLANIELLSTEFNKNFLAKKRKLLLKLSDSCPMLLWLRSQSQRPQMFKESWQFLKSAQEHGCLSPQAVLESEMSLHNNEGHYGSSLKSLEQLIAIDGANFPRLIQKTQLQLTTGQTLQAEITLQQAAALNNDAEVKNLSEQIKAKKLQLLGELAVNK